MAPSSPETNDDDREIDQRFRDEIATREAIVDYEVVEATPKHVLIRATERTDENGPRTVLYRVQHEVKPNGTEHMHWEYLGPVYDEE